MKEIIKRHLIITYLFIMTVLSVLGVIIQNMCIGAQAYSIMLPQLAPGITAIALWMFLKDEVAINHTKKQLLWQDINKKYLFISILMPFAIMLVTAIVLTLLGVQYCVWIDCIVLLIENVVCMLIGCVAEEIGWRGFLLPHMQTKYTPMTSAILVGTIWGVWHLNFQTGLSGFCIYVLNCILVSIVMTWIFNKTDGNIVCMVLWHFMGNFGFHLFLWNRDFTNTFLMINVLYVILISMSRLLYKNENVK